LLFYLWVIFQSIPEMIDFNRSISFSGLIFLVCFGLTGVWMIYVFLIACTFETYIEIDANSVLFRRKIFGWRIQNIRVIGQIGRILQANLKNIFLSLRQGSPITVCTLTIKKRHNIRFASFLSEEEKQWLIGEIQDFVERQKLKLKES